MRKPVTFVSGNKSKIEEAEKILGIELKSVKLDLEEIQDSNIEAVARYKVEQAYEKIKSPVFVDDVGFYIDAWSGFPGPFIKFIDKAGGMSLLLKMLKEETNRKVIAKTVIAYHDGEISHSFIGAVEGTIPTQELGRNGFGWDTVFIPNGSDKTYAEMTDEEKNAVSQRKIALEKFSDFIKKNSPAL